MTVFKEDFDRERSDRAHAQSAKDDLRKEVEGEHRKNRILQDKLKTTERQVRGQPSVCLGRFSEFNIYVQSCLFIRQKCTVKLNFQLRSSEKNVEQTMAENLQIRKENQRLKKEVSEFILG